MSISAKQMGDLLAASGQPRIGAIQLTPEQRKELTTTGRIPSAALQDADVSDGIVLKAQCRSKYNAVRTVDADGVKWDSKAERRRWGELKIMEHAGVITDLYRQITFPIHVHGVEVGKYIADFQYRRVADDAVIVEDFKGVRTALYNFKKRCVLAEYGIAITEVR